MKAALLFSILLLSSQCIAADAVSGPFAKYFRKQCPKDMHLDSTSRVNPSAIRELREVPSLVNDSVEGLAKQLKIPASAKREVQAWRISGKPSWLIANVRFSGTGPTGGGWFRFFAVAVDPKSKEYSLISEIQRCEWSANDSGCREDIEPNRKFLAPYDVANILNEPEPQIFLYSLGSRNELMEIRVYQTEKPSWRQLAVGCKAEWD